MRSRRPLWLAAGVLFGAAVAGAGTLSFTCDPSVTASECNTLNTTIAGLYDSSFTNVNANIYIKFGTTSLGQSTTGFDNQVSYSTYRDALIAEDGSGAVRADAIASLPATEPALYGGANVDITSALGEALGISNLTGTTAGGVMCNIGTAGCYNGIITITNDPSTQLYFRNGTINPDAFDFYSVVEHETDEVLGTASCVDTTGAALADGCPGTNTPSAVDLYRYNGTGNLVLIDPTPGAYFSFDGGVTNGAGGALYNTLANGDDYADFISGCPSTPRIQDGMGCPGFAGLNITNDGGAEINILDAVGFNVNPTAVPEPRALLLLIPTLLLAAYFGRRRYRQAA